MTNAHDNFLDNDGIPPELTFSEMVKDLFKVDLPGNEAPFLHACLGIIGEVAELFGADSFNNLVEELGDLEFYLEAAWQQVGERRPTVVATESSLHANYHVLLLIAGCLIDVAKKAWVHNRELGREQAAEYLQDFESILTSIYYGFGLERTAVVRKNMVKLVGKSGRYASGKYSDEAALARADKQGEGA